MLTAVLFSRTTSQVLIALLTAVTAIGGPAAAYFFHRTLGRIQVTVNGRMGRIEKALDDAHAALLDAGVPVPPPSPPDPPKARL